MDNIGVAIRVRPFIERELSKDAECLWDVRGNEICQLENGVPVENNITSHTAFVFDKVYSGADSTESLYDEFAKPLVLKAMQGFNGTIFAYGQTGTGKTFTMMGLQGNPGVIPRAINDIFDLVNMAPDREFLIRVSYMEIYNEVITDLLKTDGTNLKVRNNEKNEVFVEHLSEIPITTPEDALSILQSGERQRRFGETNMNEKSSRSHTIFRVTIESKLASIDLDESSDEDGAVNVSQLNLVDLAGSERAAQTGAQGARLKESGFINKSLLTLGTVISKLSSSGEERSFIPYRDSKLTRILQNSLGGNAKTSVIATVTAAAGEETLSTLKFASRAKTIKNKPKVNEVLDGDTMMKRYRKEIKNLKKMIDELQASTKLHALKDMEQLLAENERMRKEQESKIFDLQNRIISATGLAFPVKRKLPKAARRETWCPGKLKRSLVRSSFGTLGKFDENEDTSDEPTFCDNKAGFLRDLEEEELMKSPPVKYRRSYQAGEDMKLTKNQSCQTEQESRSPTKDELKEKLSLAEFHILERDIEMEEFMITCKNADDEILKSKDQELSLVNTELELTKKELSELKSILQQERDAFVEVEGQLQRMKVMNDDLTWKVGDLEKDKDNTANPQEQSRHEIEKLERKVSSLEDAKAELCLKIDEMEIEKAAKRASIASITVQDESILGEMSRLKDLEETYMERVAAVEELNYKIEELQMENEALQEKNKQQASHMELLAKENMQLQNAQSMATVEVSSTGSDGIPCHGEELSDKNSELEANCNKLTEQLSMLSNDLQAAEDVNLNLLEQIDHLKKEIEKKDSDVQSTQAEELQNTNSVLEAKCKKFTEQLSQMSNDLQSAEDVNLNLLEQIDHLKGEIEKKDSDVHSTQVDELQNTNLELETKCSKLTEQLSMLSNDLQAAEDVNLNLLEQIDHLKEENEKKDAHSSQVEGLQNTNSELEAKCKEFTEQLSQLSDDLKSAEDVNTSLLQQIDHLKEEVEKKDVHSSQAEGLQNTNSELEARCKEFTEQLSQLSDDLKSAEDVNTNLLEQIDNLKEEVQNKDSDVHSNLNEEVQNTNLELEAKCKKFTQQLSVLSDDLQSAEEVNMNLLEQIAHLKEEVAKKDSDVHSSQVEELQSKNSELEAKCKKFSDQLSLLSEDLQSAEDVNLNLLEQIDRLKEEVVHRDSSAHSLQVEEITDQDSELEANCKKLTEQLSVLSNDLQSAEDVNVHLLEQIDHLKEEIVQKDSDTHTLQAKEINEKNAELEANCKKLTEQLSVLSNDSQSAKDVNLKLVEQIDHLKELVAMKESDTHMHQVKELNEKNSELEVNCKKLTEQLAMLSNDLQSAEDVNLNLLEQIDNLKEEVEKKESDAHLIQVEGLQNTNSELEAKCNKLTEQLSMISNDLQSAEDVNLNLLGQIDHLKEEVLKNESGAHSSQVKELQNTNSELEAKCKQFSEQLSMLSSDLQSAEDVNLNLVEQLDHLKEEMTKKESDVQSSQVEELQNTNSELEAKCKTFSEQLSILSNNLQSAEDVNLNLVEQIEKLKEEMVQKESEVQSSQVEELQNTNSELETKCKKFSEQVSMLSNDLQSAEDVNLNLVEQIEKLKEEIAKKGSDVHLSQIEELQNANSELEEKCKKFSEQLSMLSNDLQSAEDVNMDLVEQIDHLKQEMVKKESDVHPSQLEQLQNTNSELEANCNKLTEQLSMLSNDLQSAEDVNMNLVEQIYRLEEKVQKQDSNLNVHSLQLEELKDKNSDYEEKCEKLTEQLSVLSKDLQSAEDVNVSLVEKVTHLEEEIEKKDSCIKSLQVAESNSKTARSECNKLTEKLSMMTDHLQSAKDENITLVQQINHLQKEIEMKEADIDALQVKQLNHQTTKSECIKLTEQLSMLTNDLQLAKDENVTIAQQFNHLKEEILKKDSEIDALQVKLLNGETAKSECFKLSEQLSVLTDNLQAAKGENTTLVQQISYLKEEIEKKESDIEALQVKKLNDQTTKSEFIKLNEQLSMLADALQVAKDENINLAQQINNLKEDIEKKGKNGTLQEQQSPEIQQLKTENEKLKEELEEVTKERDMYYPEMKRLEKLCDESDDEIEELEKKIEKLEAEFEEQKLAAQEEISNLKTNKDEGYEKLKKELDVAKSERFENMMQAATVEKENRKLKERLEYEEKARAEYQAYHEKRVAVLKHELTLLNEAKRKAIYGAEGEAQRTRSAQQSTELFSLRSEKASLEREKAALEHRLEETNKENKLIAFEKYNLTQKFESLRTECYHLKRRTRMKTEDAETQTVERVPVLKEAVKNEDPAPKQPQMFDPGLMPFESDKKTDFNECKTQ